MSRRQSSDEQFRSWQLEASAKTPAPDKSSLDVGDVKEPTARMIWPKSYCAVLGAALYMPKLRFHNDSAAVAGENPFLLKPALLNPKDAVYKDIVSVGNVVWSTCPSRVSP